MHESEIKSLLKRLGESINETFSNSPEIHNCIRDIRDAGYEIFLNVETKIGYCHVREENRKTVVENKQPECLYFNEYDAKILKTMKIAVN